MAWGTSGSYICGHELLLAEVPPQCRYMTDKEYEDYMEEVMQARRHIKRFGNYSISPWVVKKYGFLKVKEDFEMRFGKEYQVRAAYVGKDKYYILEKKRNEVHHTAT